MIKKYEKEFLISELQRFHKENGRVPTQKDMDTAKNDYPSVQAYQRCFGSFNNGLESSGLEINRKCYELDGTEICSYCEKRADEIDDFKGWLYHDDTRYCRQHGNGGNGSPPYYVMKNLDKNSKVGKAFISQRVVAKVLGLELKDDCNCSVNFGHPYDLYDKDKYNYINVKDSHLHDDNAWHFNLNQKEIPDTYIMLGYDEDRKNILHVWITDPLDDLTYDDWNERPKGGISITNKYLSGVRGGLTKAEPWEVDAKPYNDMLHRMSEKRKETNGKECLLNNNDLRN